MDWIRENKTVASIMGVFLALAAGLGFLVFNAWSALGASRERFDSANNSLAAMKSADLFPSPENLEKKKTAVEDYEKKVSSLSKVLLSLQPASEPISETDFQAKLKARIAEVRAVAGKTTKLPADFALTFPDYTSSLPRSAEIARQLSDYLEAVDAVTRTLIESGVESVDTFERSQLAAEKDATAAGSAPAAGSRPATAKGPPAKPGAAPKEIAKMVERRTLTLTLTCDQGPLQKVLNRLASPSQMPYFTAIRLLRVENEKNEGPLRSAISSELDKQKANAFDNEGGTAGQDVPAVTPEGQPIPAAPVDNSMSAAKPGLKDAVGVLGQEKLRAYLEIDLINFIDSSDKTAEAAATEK